MSLSGRRVLSLAALAAGLAGFGLPPRAFPQSLADFEARAAALVRSVEAAPTTSDPSDTFDLAGLEDLGDESMPPAPADPLPGFDGFADRIDLLTRPVGGTRIQQTLVANHSDSSFTSSAEGETTTRVASLIHTLALDRALGASADLSLVNTLELGRTRDRESFEAGYVRQLGATGEWGAATRLELQRAKNGEVEPDYDLAELSVRRLFDRFPASSLELRGYGRRQDYQDDDAFYLDSETTGFELDGSRHRGRLDSSLRLALDGERYPAAPANDVNRLVADASVTATFGRLEARASAGFQHEAVLDPDPLEPWRMRTGELALVREFSRSLSLEVAAGYESRSVDALSRSNYDYLERQERAVATLGIGPALDATLTMSRSTRINRDKRPGDRIDERADDQDRADLELYLGWSRGRAQASFTASRGETRYLRGQTQAFADEDRESLSASLGWSFDEAHRLDLSLSRDRSSFPSFPVNDTASDTVSVSLTRTF